MTLPGPLARDTTNPRYFTDPAGRAVFLTGSHHWDSVQDNGERPGGFDFTRYLDRLAGWGHSFVRLWAHEAWVFDLHPTIYPRTGAGLAADGRPRFDLAAVSTEYLARLRDRVMEAGERGLYVSVMLFNGWSVRDNGDGNPWPRHPFHRANNVNGIDGDPGGRGDGAATHTLSAPAIAALQRGDYVSAVAAVGDLPHVLFEIANESSRASFDWQVHMMRHLRGALAARGFERPVGLTFPYPGGANRRLFGSEADWVSPGPRGGWRQDPPANRGDKAVLLDTDHLWGIGGNRQWVWKAFLRGHQPIYMDPLDDDPTHEDARRAMGAARRWSDALDLRVATPQPDRASSGFCLASLAPGSERLLAYLTEPGRLRLDLRGLEGEWTCEWADPRTDRRIVQANVVADRRITLESPLDSDALVFLARRTR